MKKLSIVFTSCFLFLMFASVATAAIVTGFVFCDANQNSAIDSIDVPIANVLVVVTNQTGSFSNSAVTATDGSFNIQIPNFDPLQEIRDPLSQVYVESIKAATLPAGSTIILPIAITNLSLTPVYFIDFVSSDSTNLIYTSGSGNSSTGNWLINNPDCQINNNCTLSGGGIIRGENSKKPTDTFEGNVFPGGGQWSHISHLLNLKFQSTVVQIDDCGAGTMDFSGSGILIGFGRNKTDFGTVLFTARAEDNGQPGKKSDRYYLRVYTSDGVTLLLVSGDPANPANIVTVPISAGNLRVRSQ